MEQDKLAKHLDNLKRDNCYRVEQVLKQSVHETTEVVYFVGSNGAEQGPYIRKYLASALGFGSVYMSLFKAWSSGRRYKHIPIVFDCFNTGEHTIVLMEYVVGETLHDAVYRRDPSITLSQEVFPAICDALIELHEGFSPPIIHRDLKPSNIMLSEGSLTLIDFGISRLYSEGASEDTHHFGTRLYAPPEQFGFGQTDIRSDVFSLGMLLYYCLTERNPTAEIREKGFFDDAIPDALRYVLSKATALDPQQRYASVRELKQAFLQVSLTWGLPQSSELPQPKTTQASAPHKPSLPRLLSRIPRRVGVVWNISVLLVFALLFFVACVSTFSPQPEYAHIPLYGRMMLYGSLVLLFLGSLFFFVLDKRMFKGIAPFIAGMTLLQQFALFLSMLLVGALGVYFTTLLWA